RIDVNALRKGRNFPGNKGRLSNSKDNVFCRALTVDPPKKSADFCPEKSSVSTLKARQNTVRKCWMSGHFYKGDKCWYSHYWSRGDGFAMLAKLEGHKKLFFLRSFDFGAIKGISLPSGHDKLYSGSSDGTARIWDGHTGKCLHFIDLGDEAGSLITEGSWCSLALNIHSALELNLKGPVGQVSAMIVAGDMLIATAQNCGIIAWRASCETDSFQLAASMEGHNGAVSCLAVACGRQNVIFWVPG
ncbi:hypothetical protein Golob_003993, partial [Gossypium lobatum]|nr:hypothetical protein [Gossypium lobatum]